MTALELADQVTAAADRMLGTWKNWPPSRPVTGSREQEVDQENMRLLRYGQNCRSVRSF